MSGKRARKVTARWIQRARRWFLHRHATHRDKISDMRSFTAELRREGLDVDRMLVEYDEAGEREKKREIEFRSALARFASIICPLNRGEP